MFSVNGNPILVDDLEVLLELKRQLSLNGKDIFSKIKVGETNIQVCCPIHNNGQEKKPSCGITRVNKKEIPAGTVHCFACGYSASLEEMISNCFGYNDGGLFGIKWLSKNFLTVEVDLRKPIDLKLNKVSNNVNNFISEKELDKYRYYHSYMYKRKLTNEIIDKFDIGYDKNFKLKEDGNKIECITFPVRDKQGRTLFIGRRAIKFKLFNYPKDVDKPVYGLYEMPKNCNEVIICESFLNALTCYVYGKVGVALIGTGTKTQYKQLEKLNCRKFIMAFDGDEAGERATEKLKNYMVGKKLITHYLIPKGKDINNLSKEEFNNLEEIF